MNNQDIKNFRIIDTLLFLRHKKSYYWVVISMIEKKNNAATESSNAGDVHLLFH